MYTGTVYTLQYNRVQRSPLSPPILTVYATFTLWNVGPILYEYDSSLSIYV